MKMEVTKGLAKTCNGPTSFATTNTGLRKALYWLVLLLQSWLEKPVQGLDLDCAISPLVVSGSLMEPIIKAKVVWCSSFWMWIWNSVNCCARFSFWCCWPSQDVSSVFHQLPKICYPLLAHIPSHHVAEKLFCCVQLFRCLATHPAMSHMYTVRGCLKLSRTSPWSRADSCYHNGVA